METRDDSCAGFIQIWPWIAVISFVVLTGYLGEYTGLPNLSQCLFISAPSFVLYFFPSRTVDRCSNRWPKPSKGAVTAQLFGRLSSKK
jgi:hypothetical protein